MIHYGKRSQAVLAELHHDLRTLFKDYSDLAPPDLDLTLIDGYRDGAEQDAALARGASTLPAGKSKHNVRPARACDFRVYPEIPDGDLERVNREYGKRVGFLLALAARRGIELRCGIDWKKPFDPYHVELVG